MHRFPSATALISATKPDIPVMAVRPHAAGRAARWFIENFPGDVAYAYKANSSVFLLGALYGAGIRHFDVASLPEIEDAADVILEQGMYGGLSADDVITQLEDQTRDAFSRDGG